MLTYHNDLARTGQNLAETVLTTTNVNTATFGRLFVRKVDADVYAQPLVVTGVDVPGKGLRNVVYVATQNDSVYAFDAETNKGTGKKAFWKRTLRPPGATAIPATLLSCDDLVPKVGITGTPVIDKASGTLYVVARTREAGALVQRLYALDIATGADKLPPVVIAAQVPGTGDGSSNGVLAFEPATQNQRPGLLLLNGVVYIAWASHCDVDPYHGWVIGYDAATLAQTLAWTATPDGQRGGIWQSGAAPSVDPQGRIFLSTGNGTFDADGSELGDSIISLDASLNVLDWFTPFNEAVLESQDLDLGSAGVLVLPDQSGPHPHVAVSAGKEGTIYVVDRDDLGHFNPVDDSQIVQVVSGALAAGAYDMPAYFDGKVYVNAAYDALKAFTVTNGLLSVFATDLAPDVFGFPGATPSISANGSAEGIVWVLQRNVGTKAPWRLHAHDAQDVSNELYDSGDQGQKGYAGKPVKFAVPTVANGKVYVGAHNRLTVFGLKPAP